MKGKKYIYDKVTKKMIPREEFVRLYGVLPFGAGPAVVENSRKMGAHNFNRLGSSRRA
jgi:hypothetical protein